MKLQLGEVRDLRDAERLVEQVEDVEAQNLEASLLPHVGRTEQFWPGDRSVTLARAGRHYWKRA